MKAKDIPNVIGLLLLVVAFAYALNRHGRTTMEDLDPDTKVVRFAHWQLEPGVRQAFDKIVAEYTKLRPDVRVVQMAVPESAYRQYVSTQLVGGTAPDLIELQTGQIWDLHLARYFMPITEIVEKPNPYNKGTIHEGKPWKDTYVDGMQSSFNDSLMEYYGAPSTMTTVRLFYNKDLLREITGSGEAPDTYADFIGVCETILDYARRQRRILVPLSGSQAHAPMLTHRIWCGMTVGEARKCDLDYDGYSYVEESFLGYLNGRWNWESPGVRAGLEITNYLGRYFQPGYMQLVRSDSWFYFIQKRAVFLAGGTWDCEGLVQNADFEVGVCEFPLPDKSDPQYGAVVTQRRAETFNPHFQFGLVRFSRQKEAAIDFLQFLTSVHGNQTFCDASGWLPAVRGVKPLPEKLVFMPKLDGSYHQLRYYFRSATGNACARWGYLLREPPPEGGADRFIRKFWPEHIVGGVKDIIEDAQQKLDGMGRMQARVTAYGFLRELAGDDAEEAKWARKYLIGLQGNVEIEDMRGSFFELTLKGAKAKRRWLQGRKRDLPADIERTRDKIAALKSRLEDAPVEARDALAVQVETLEKRLADWRQQQGEFDRLLKDFDKVCAIVENLAQ